jgi:small conductance mechanosensitive channel
MTNTISSLIAQSTNTINTLKVESNNTISALVLESTNPDTGFGAAFYALITVFLAWLISRATKLAIHRYLDRIEKAGADTTGIRFVSRLVSGMIYLAAFACYAHVIPKLQTLGKSLLAGVGVASVVVGLAAQSTLGNLIAGISLILYRPFKVGDRVQVSAPTGLETGVVMNIDLGFTVLRTQDQRLLVIPNSSMASQATVNLTALAPRTPCNVSLYVATGSDVAKARQILLDIAKAHPKIAQVDGCFATRVTGRGVVLTLAASSADPDAATGVKSDFLENAKKQFDAAGIRIV